MVACAAGVGMGARRYWIVLGLTAMLVAVGCGKDDPEKDSWTCQVQYRDVTQKYPIVAASPENETALTEDDAELDCEDHNVKDEQSKSLNAINPGASYQQECSCSLKSGTTTTRTPTAP